MACRLRACAIAVCVAAAELHPTWAQAPKRQASPPAAAADGWRDTTNHKSGFISVARGVQLHYLDYGGSGPPVLLIPGLGNTAHAWDDFGPRLTDRFHVYAITRRGFGESSHPATGYDTKRLVEDLHVVIDRLHMTRAIFIGHSIAGEEMTRFAATYPDRVAKLVYLDAAYDRVAGDSIIDEIFPVPPNVPPRPQPTAADTATPAAYVAFVHKTRGVNTPESDIRTRYAYDGWNEDITVAAQSMGVEHPNYRAIRAPALAIYAVTDSVSQLEPWQRSDRAHAAGLLEMVRGTEFVYRKLRQQFRDQVQHGGVVEIHGAHHWIFVSNRDEVLSAVRRFLSTP